MLQTISTGTWILWACLLVLQNAAFTFVSRARNSGSYGLHIVAAFASNGVWMTTQFVSLAVMIDVIKTGTLREKVAVGLFYSVCTVVGSVAMHWVGKTFIEKGNRKVGA